MKGTGTSGRGGEGARGERGSALVVVLLAVVVVGAMSAGLLLVASGRTTSARERLRKEAAFECAEAGLDRGIAEANKPANRLDPSWPPPGLAIAASPANQLRNAAGNVVGTFTVAFLRGDSDGIDNDANGLLDGADPDEEKFVTVESVGSYGGAGGASGTRAAVRSQILKTSIVPRANSSIFIDDPSPDLGLGSSNSYKIDGRDHDMTDRTLLPGAPALPALATTGSFSGPDQADINAKTGSQIFGVPVSSNGTPDNVDIDAILEAMKVLTPPAQQILVTGVNPPGPFGTPPSPGVTPDWQLTLHTGYTKCTGNKKGAGLWVIDGDLDVSGTLVFTGVIIVRGKISFSGGGSGTQVTGAIISSEAPYIDFTVTGTSDIFFSSEAVANAQLAAARFVVRAWKQIPVP